MPGFRACFPSASTRDIQDDDEALSSSGYMRGCIFCDVTKENGFNIIHEDEEFIAFHDRTRRAKTHILIIPREHVVSTVKDLRQDHLPLLKRMDNLAQILVPNSSKSGFHIPPFSSVHHLHLHVFEPPFTAIGKVKYPVSGTEERKGWGWFVSMKQVQGILERGGRVGLGRG